MDIINNNSFDDLECPLCLEEIDITDKYFKPCPCGYQICRFCWNHIKEDLNSLCPACRRLYSDENIVFKPVPADELVRIKTLKKKKDKDKKDVDLAARKQLANVRVIQKNLVYVLGLPNRLASEESLKSNDFFGQYGKINKIVINRKPPPNSNPSANSHTGVYITYVKKEDAAKAIEAVDGSVCDNRMIRATYGTTKYCSFFLKNQTCLNSGCQFLHEPGEEADSFTKDELIPQSKVTPKPPPFPFNGVGNVKLDDKEESALPVSAGWAKPLGDTSKAPDDMMVIKNRSQTPTKRLLSGQVGASEQQSGPGYISTGVPTMVFPETAEIHTLVQPLRIVNAHYDILLLKLSTSGRQPKYSGPFDPFREEQMIPQSIPNTKPSNVGNISQEHSDFNSANSRSQDPQLSYAQDAFRNVFPNGNGSYAINQARSVPNSSNLYPGISADDRSALSQNMNYNRNVLGFMKGMDGSTTHQSKFILLLINRYDRSQITSHSGEPPYAVRNAAKSKILGANGLIPLKNNIFSSATSPFPTFNIPNNLDFYPTRQDSISGSCDISSVFKGLTPNVLVDIDRYSVISSVKYNNITTSETSCSPKQNANHFESNSISNEENIVDISTFNNFKINSKSEFGTKKNTFDSLDNISVSSESKSDSDVTVCESKSDLKLEKKSHGNINSKISRYFTELFKSCIDELILDAKRPKSEIDKSVLISELIFSNELFPTDFPITLEYFDVLFKTIFDAAQLLIPELNYLIMESKNLHSLRKCKKKKKKVCTDILSKFKISDGSALSIILKSNTRGFFGLIDEVECFDWNLSKWEKCLKHIESVKNGIMKFMKIRSRCAVESRLDNYKIDDMIEASGELFKFNELELEMENDQPPRTISELERELEIQRIKRQVEEALEKAPIEEHEELKKLQKDLQELISLYTQLVAKEAQEQTATKQTKKNTPLNSNITTELVVGQEKKSFATSKSTFSTNPSKPAAPAKTFSGIKKTSKKDVIHNEKQQKWLSFKPQKKKSLKQPKDDLNSF